MLSPDRLKAISVLVLDDDPFMIEDTLLVLEGLGVGPITTHTSSSAALATLAMHDAQQLVLCDLNMPGMDGVEVIRQLGLQRFSGAIIVLSGEDPRLLRTVAELGPAYGLRLLGALRKPVNGQELVNLLIKGMDAPRPSHVSTVPELSEAELREGLAAGALTPYYQPKVEAVTRRVVGVEALARWRHPQHGILGPNHFIPLAEQSDAIMELTERMLLMAMQQLRAWKTNGLDLKIAVNLSMHAVNDLAFPDRLVAQAGKVGIELDRLLLEITESQLSLDMRIASDVLSRLCLKRIRLSVDDFGTAYSNMEKLRMLPFSELKIDRSFVHNAAHNPAALAILNASAALGRQLGMGIVAEGVENQEDWDTAARAGCDMIQGYHVARPMPVEELMDWLRHWR